MSDNCNVSQRNFQSLCIDDARFLLAIALVLFHTFALSVFAGLQIDGYQVSNGFKNWVDSFFNGDSIVAVYFFISGYLFFLCKEWNIKVYTHKLRNRIHTLLIPYLLWNAIGICLVIFKSLPIFDAFLSYSGTGIDLSIQNLLSCFWMYDGRLSAPPAGTENLSAFVSQQSFPINTALWFVRDLMIVVIFTPLLHFLIKRLRLIFLALLGIAYVFFSYRVIDWHINQLTMAFFFFSFGAYLSIRGKTISGSFKKFYAASVVVYILCSVGSMFVSTPAIATLLKIIHSFALIFFTFAIVSYFLHRFKFSLNFNVMALSTFIYMSHCLVVPRVMKIITFVIGPDSDMLWLTVYLLSFISALLLLAVCFFICKKYMPSLLKVLIGGRI